jgi:hypothetical protein
LISRTYLSKRQKLDAIRASKPSFEPKKKLQKKAFIREDQDDDYDVSEDQDDASKDAEPMRQSTDKGSKDRKSSREFWASKEGQIKKVRVGTARKRMEDLQAVRGMRIDTSSLPLNDRKGLMDSKSLENKVQDLLLAEPWKLDKVIAKLVMDKVLLKPEMWGAAAKVLIRNGYYPQAKKLFEVVCTSHVLKTIDLYLTSS